MSWPLLLAGYPRAILQDSLPLVVLALLERGGLVAEANLLKQAGADEKRLKEVLFDLRLNKLIEYGSHHLRLTERGRTVVSRFDLDKDVTSNILDFLRLEEDQREPFRLAIGAYRDTAYRFYLNSLCSLWTWGDLASRTLRQEAIAPSEEVVAGMRTLLARDIDQWWKSISSHKVASSFPKRVQDGCFSLTDTLRKWETFDDTAGLLARFSRVLESPHLELAGGVEAKRAKETPVVLVFISFTKFRSTSEPDLWFDRWHEVKLKLPEPRRRQRIQSYARQIHDFIAERTESVSDSSSLYKIEPTFLSGRRPLRSDNFLGQLLMAQSLGDLAASAGVSREDLAALLDDIIDKCHALIDAEPSGGADG